MHFRLVVPRFM